LQFILRLPHSSYLSIFEGGSKNSKNSPFKNRSLSISYTLLLAFLRQRNSNIRLFSISHFFNIQKQEQKLKFVYLTHNTCSCHAKRTLIFYVLWHLCEATFFLFITAFILFQQQKNKKIYYPVRSQGPDTLFRSHIEIWFFYSDGPTH